MDRCTCRSHSLSLSRNTTGLERAVHGVKLPPQYYCYYYRYYYYYYIVFRTLCISAAAVHTRAYNISLLAAARC